MKRRASELDEMGGGVAGEPAYRKKARTDLPGIWGAIALGNEEKARTLLEAKLVDFSAKDEEGLTPLERAVKSGSRPMLELMWGLMWPVVPDADECRALQTAAFFAAVEAGNADILGYMLGQRRALVEAHDKHARTALHLACWAGQEQVVKLLLLNLASVSAQDADGNTPLMLAAMADAVFLLELLQESGASLHAVNHAGRNALTQAMLNGSYRVMEWLLSKGVVSYKLGEGDYVDALAVDLYQSEAPRAGLFSFQSEIGDQQAMPPPEDCAAWLKQLAKRMLPLKNESCVLPEDDLSRLLGPIAAEQGLMQTAMGALSSYVGLCAALCLPNLSDAEFQQKGERPAHWPGSSRRITAAQRDQVLAGLLAHLSSEPGEARIRASGVSGYVQARLINKHARQIDWLKAIGQPYWTAPCKKFGPDFAERIVNCIGPEGQLLENKLRALLRREFGLFESVSDLLVGAIDTARQRCQSRTVDSGLFDCLGAMQEELGAHYARVPEELPAVLRSWDQHLRESYEEVLKLNASSASDGSRQALLDAWQREQKEVLYIAPPAFHASLRAGLGQLTGAGFDSHDLYLDLVYDQWRAVRAALLRALDPQAEQASEAQAGTDQPQASQPETPPDPQPAPPPAAAGIYSADLGMMFTELGDGLELDP